MSRAKTPTQDHHFYGCTPTTWVVGATREAVLKKLAVSAGAAWIKRSQAAGQPGVYAWTCRVAAPQSTSYGIRNYVPQGVEWSESQEGYLTNARGAFYEMPQSREDDEA